MDRNNSWFRRSFKGGVLKDVAYVWTEIILGSDEVSRVGEEYKVNKKK
jgi:hypothetical protein